ncbi:hypothetical protein FCM35_KLT21510 [Carex littledalei]|uniref:Uncharacterized protein n=1 Tax=Carex littledalei TaxID=544730 RepID=A0A833R8H4_9POAL|nr:hypothetical protein FCM35_KLT21510 [Carex littledalei]
METITSKVYKTIKEYLRHKTYRRLKIRPRQSRPIRLSRRVWRVKIAQPTIKLQSKPNSRVRIKRSYVTDMLVFLSGGEGGLVSGRRTDKKCIDDQVCGQQTSMSRQVSGNGWEFKRKMMLNVNIAELLSPRRSYNERHGYADLRAVNSFRISVST